MQAIEAEVKHDVIAFVSAVAETVGDEGRYLHLGFTSSDVLDTAFAIQLRDAADLLLVGVDDVARGVAQVEEAAFVANALRDRGHERDHVVLHLGLDLLHAPDVHLGAGAVWNEVDALPESDRGVGGFGSTGDRQ